MHVISIDKGSPGKPQNRRHVSGRGENLRGISFKGCILLACPSLPSQSFAKMSALQTFLLVVDHNKEEAKQIAERVAHGEYFCLEGRQLVVVRF